MGHGPKTVVSIRPDKTVSAVCGTSRRFGVSQWTNCVPLDAVWHRLLRMALGELSGALAPSGIRNGLSHIGCHCLRHVHRAAVLSNQVRGGGFGSVRQHVWRFCHVPLDQRLRRAAAGTSLMLWQERGWVIGFEPTTDVVQPAVASAMIHSPMANEEMAQTRHGANVVRTGSWPKDAGGS